MSKHRHEHRNPYHEALNLTQQSDESYWHQLEPTTDELLAIMKEEKEAEHYHDELRAEGKRRQAKLDKAARATAPKQRAEKHRRTRKRKRRNE